jgi:membrane-associated protease RseP (regulator of RpoE activity)
LLLPGYTRYSPPSARFDTAPFWNALVDMATALRPELRSPLLIQPGYYWNRSITAHMDGIYPGSPAERVGLRFGDRIVRIDDTPIITRAEASHFLDQAPAEGKPWTTRIEVERDGARFTVDLSNELAASDDHYPYKPRGCPASHDFLGRWAFGVQLMDGFDLHALQALKELVDKHPGVRRVLVFTTPLVGDLYAQAMRIVGNLPQFAMPGVEVRVTVAPQSYWGGNIVIGDLNVVQDFIDHVNDVAGRGHRPDLVVIPGSFANRWGLDVLGHSYLEIERRTGVQTELLPVRRVMV